MQITVLVVEDDFLIAEDYVTAIEAQGWRVLGPAATGNDGLDLLQSEDPDVALLDLMLKRSLSTLVAEALVSKGVPFILASACEDPVAIGGEIFRSVVCVGKPASPSEVISALSYAIAKSKASTTGD